MSSSEKSSGSREQEHGKGELGFMETTDLDAGGDQRDMRGASSKTEVAAGTIVSDDDDDGNESEASSSDTSSCAVSVASSSVTSGLTKPEEASVTSSNPKPPQRMRQPSSAAGAYSGPFSSAAAATAAAPVSSGKEGSTPARGNPLPLGVASATKVGVSPSPGGGKISASWKSDWDREEQQHALAKSLARHRKALNDTHKLRDSAPSAGASVVGGVETNRTRSGSGSGAGAIADSGVSEYDSDDTANTEKTGVGGPGIVPRGQQVAYNDNGAQGADNRSTRSSGVGSVTASSGVSGSSRIIKPRSDIMGARGLMAKHRKSNNKVTDSSKGGSHGKNAKVSTGVSDGAADVLKGKGCEGTEVDSKQEDDGKRNFAFIARARGASAADTEGHHQPRGGLLRRGRKRKGDPIDRRTVAQCVCIAVVALSAAVVAIAGGLLPNTGAGQTVRAATRDAKKALMVAVSGTEGAETPRVSFDEERANALPTENSPPTGPNQEEAPLDSSVDQNFPDPNRERRDEQMDKKRSIDAMLSSMGHKSSLSDSDQVDTGEGSSSLRGWGDVGADSSVLGTLGAGSNRYRHLGMMHIGGQYRGLSHPGTANANILPQYGGITHPSILPPLEEFSTAEKAGGHGIFIPRTTSLNYADVWDSVTRMDMPLFWRIPRSGGRTVQAVLGKCLGAVQASELGKDLAARFFKAQTLTVHTNDEGYRYVNVDTTSATGLRRAKQMGVVSIESTSPVDVVVTTLFHDAAVIFDEIHRGRAFALFRHPVRRVTSTYFDLVDESNNDIERDENLVARVRTMSILEYVQSDLSDENLVVRVLTQDYEGTVTAQHVEVAKEIMRRKILVGITEVFDESLVRFERYMGWWDVVADNEHVLECQREIVAATDGRYGKPHVTPGTVEFHAIAEKNWADIALYNYAKTLFHEQASLA